MSDVLPVVRRNGRIPPGAGVRLHGCPGRAGQGCGTHSKGLALTGAARGAPKYRSWWTVRVRDRSQMAETALRLRLREPGAERRAPTSGRGWDYR